jgi:hypothetical protein
MQGHVLLDNAFVRFHPQGAFAPGMVYPIEDASALRSLLEQLPPAPLTR